MECKSYSLKYITGLLLILLFYSCVPQSQFVFIEPYDVLHDNSSKVWLVDTYKRNLSTYSTRNLKSKSLIVFHSSRNCYQFDFTSFGNEPGLKGKYKLNYQKKEFYIYFNNRKLSYKIHKLSSEVIVLSSIDKGKKEYLQLISFPEIND